MALRRDTGLRNARASSAVGAQPQSTATSALSGRTVDTSPDGLPACPRQHAVTDTNFHSSNICNIRPEGISADIIPLPRALHTGILPRPPYVRARARPRLANSPTVAYA